MFETSKDFLNLALGVGGFLALFALAWVFAYTAGILRQVYKAMTTIEGAFDAVRGFFNKVGDKVSDMSALGKFAVDAVKLVADMKEVKSEAKGQKSGDRKRK
ncbi:hypothetical protein IT409_01395 [Candidatus Falkowbacteria bacterium]|nr:hypothetical protein [Candidatus Falkowbacteria bacterium]